MKKRILSLSMLFLVCNARMLAQSKDTASTPLKTGNEWHMPGDVIKRSQDFSDRLTKDLGLDETRSKKVFTAFIENTKPVDEIKMGPLDDKAKAQALKHNRESFKAKLKDILSSAQYDKFIKIGDDKKLL
jgi:hypothetical protein